MDCVNETAAKSDLITSQETRARGLQGTCKGTGGAYGSRRVPSRGGPGAEQTGRKAV